MLGESLKLSRHQPVRQDYAMLVGKTKPQALQDIRAFLEEGILKKYGSGRSVVYIK